MADGLMRRHPSPLARTVWCKPPQARNERSTLGAVSEITFHTSTPNIERRTRNTNHEPTNS